MREERKNFLDPKASVQVETNKRKKCGKPVVGLKESSS